MKEVSSHVQEWLIAIALAIVIPATVYLGVVLIAPKVDFNEYHKERKLFFKNYSRNKVQEYQEREKEWKQSEFAINFEKNKGEKRGMMLLVSEAISCILFFAGSTFVLPIVACGLLVAGMLTSSLNYFIYGSCATFHGMNLQLVEMLFCFISLLIVLWYAYQSSEKNNIKKEEIE